MAKPNKPPPSNQLASSFNLVLGMEQTTSFFVEFKDVFEDAVRVHGKPEVVHHLAEGTYSVRLDETGSFMVLSHVTYDRDYNPHNRDFLEVIETTSGQEAKVLDVPKEVLPQPARGGEMLLLRSLLFTSKFWLEQCRREGLAE